MKKNSILILVILLSLSIFSQNKPDRCDVVFEGKNKGFIHKEKFLLKTELVFYNKYCKSKIIGYKFISVYNGKVVSYWCNTDFISNDIISFVNSFEKTNRIILSVNCIDEYNNEYISLVNLNIIKEEYIN